MKTFRDIARGWPGFVAQTLIQMLAMVAFIYLLHGSIERAVESGIRNAQTPTCYDVRIGQVTVDEYYTDAGVDE